MTSNQIQEKARLAKIWTAGFQTEGRSSAKEPRQSGNVLYTVIKKNGSLIAGEH